MRPRYHPWFGPRRGGWLSTVNYEALLHVTPRECLGCPWWLVCYLSGAW